MDKAKARMEKKTLVCRTQRKPNSRATKKEKKRAAGIRISRAYHFRPVTGDHGHGISPDCEVSPVPKGKQAGVTQQQIKAQAHNSKGDAVFKEHQVVQGKEARARIIEG